MRIGAVFGQLLVLAVFAAPIGYFSFSPSYRHSDDDQALIKLSFSHGAERKGGCRERTAEELAALPENMRTPLQCPRERLAVLVELEVDGEVLYRRALPPSGIAGDGPSSVYERFAVPVGEHRIVARLRDTAREEGFDHTAALSATLGSREVLVVDFKADAGGFLFD